MKNKIYILLLILLLSSIIELRSQTFTNEGKLIVAPTGRVTIKNNGMLTNSDTIVNQGKIFLNGTSTALDSKGEIKNTGGLIRVEGNMFIDNVKQSSINGSVIFSSSDTIAGNNQKVPQMIYDSVSFFGKTPKQLTVSNQNLTSKKLFVMDSAAPIWTKDASVKIYTESETFNNGLFNPTYSFGQVIMNGTTAQPLGGKGQFKQLELDNAAGADVVQGGGFKINKELKLTRGEIRNNKDSNFIIENGAKIIKYAAGSLKESPVFEAKANLEYAGNVGDPINSSSGEVPDAADSNAIQNLLVSTPSGMQLNKKLTINDTITLFSNIKTFTKDSKDSITSESELVLTSQNNPVFADLDSNSEIEGKFTRKNIVADGTKILFNNRLTWGSYESIAKTNGVTTLSMDIKPFLPYNYFYKRGSDKVRRQITLSALDANGNKVDSSGLKFQYAWRHDKANRDTTSGKTETPFPAFNKEDKLVLQRWTGDPKLGKWSDVRSSAKSAKFVADSSYWMTGMADSLGLFGELGIGFTIQDYLQLTARYLMEGAYRRGTFSDTELMATNLADSMLVPSRPPHIYPYILDKMIDSIPAADPKEMKANRIVDWVTIEFRQNEITDAIDPARGRYFRTCLLKMDGTLVDSDCITPVTLSQKFTMGVDSSGVAGGVDTSGRTAYFIAIRHRNHLTVMTASKFNLVQGALLSSLIDFTEPTAVFGYNSNVPNGGSTKPIGPALPSSLTGLPLYGAVAGNFVSPNLTLTEDEYRNELLKGISGMDFVDQNDYDQISKYLYDSDLMQINDNAYTNQDIDLSGIVTTNDFNLSWNNRYSELNSKLYFSPIK